MENRLKHFRELKGLSQAEVAKKIYVTRQTISNWENTHNLPPLAALGDLSALYKVSVSSLIGEDLIIMKKKLNYFALFGVLSFTLVFGTIAGVFVGIFLIAGWICSGMFSLSPFLLLYAEINGQAFSWTQTGLSIALMLVGVPLLYLMYILTKKIIKLIMAYCKYSLGSLFYEVKREERRG